MTDSSKNAKSKAPVLPTVRWRERRNEEQRDIDSGALRKDEAFLTRIHPDAFLSRMEVLFKKYVESVNRSEKTAAGYGDVMRAIQVCLEGVNAVNRDYDGSSVETDEREVICEFLENVIVWAGIDIDALAASQKCTRHELTDRWREW